MLSAEDLCCGDCPRWRDIVGEGMRGVCLDPEDTDLAWIRSADEPACDEQVERFEAMLAEAESLRAEEAAEWRADARRDDR